MAGSQQQWVKEFKSFVKDMGDDELFASLDSLLHASRNNFAFNRKIMEKAIDVSWVETIENGLFHVDNVIRNPRRTIEDVEEVVPIALSRKITVESVKHLAQHTDLIQSIDKKTGRITPSKILNVYKEESLMTYENKFVNTLVDRLYIFINRRYEKLAQVAKDEEVLSLGYDTDIDDGSGGKMKININIETIDSLDKVNESGLTVWQRVEKLKKIIEEYKGSELCLTLGNTYIRPPVMRTNAIMKNVDLKACLTLWQYIESYDKVGYEINVQNTAVKPDIKYVEDFYKVVIMSLLLFRSYNAENGNKKLEEMKTVKQRSLQPRFLKHFDKELASTYDIQTEAAAGYLAADSDQKLIKKMPEDVSGVIDQVSKVIEIERNYMREQERLRQERIKAEEEAERLRQEELARQEELRRIEEAKEAERERIRQQQQEEERQLREMLEQKRREQEEAEKERARQEEIRLARLEEERKREEEERLKREKEEAEAAERERIRQEKLQVMTELGEAEGLAAEQIEEEAQAAEEAEEQKAYEEVTEAEIEEVKNDIEEEAAENEEQPEEVEDPRAIAARMKLEQQKREKERRERERAERLKAERQRFESKPFREIYKEYSKNPIYAIPRLIRYILAFVFGIIPEDTDNPDLREKLAKRKAEAEAREIEQAKHIEMEGYYKKYAQTFKYRFMRKIGDIKFKRKKKKERKNSPRPVYKPPVRTAEEQRAIDTEMKRLYKEYHVSLAERFRRWLEEFKFKHRRR
ncbi:DUF2357 domain-containing protein [Ruminococcus sp. NK3A76]|uniref:DUF2357 domain-containing protein n=1 Tax=Ruminococcus sp. NK3A76 TaxID=877411 RepID=UPI00068A14F2|nr:DUF2357 domain-containing protein [Ruminococcus sp. NK3A76]